MVAIEDGGKVHLLIVDDDPGLCGLLGRYLGEAGFTVSSVGDGVAMDRFLQTRQPDLVILDLMLPGEDGLSLARRLRAGNSELPVIMLSARGDEVDRIVGLEMGADDYLPKPFNPRELLARIKALLRRTHAAAREHDWDASNYRFDKFELDLVCQELRCNGSPLHLTTSEFTLLRVFVENPEQELSRDDLVQKLKGYERQPYDRSIDVRVARIRKKIEPDITNPSFIRTVWGRGYIFTPTGTMR